jgi:GWxTD domain-containing protein
MHNRVENRESRVERENGREVRRPRDKGAGVQERILLASCFLLLASPVAALVSQRGTAGAPTFHYTFLRFPVEDSSEATTRLDIRVAVANDEIVFVAQGDSFRASYEVSVALSSREDHRQVAGRSWRQSLTVGRSEETSSRRDFDLSMTSLIVRPGRYRLAIQMVDLESRKWSRGTANVDIPFSAEKGDVRISDILLVRSLNPTFDPIADAIISELRETNESRHDLSAYVEILFPPLEHEGKVIWTISDLRGKPLQTDTSELRSDVRLVRKILPLSPSLEAGRYRLKVSVRSGKREIEAAGDFTVPGEGVFLSEKALSLAVEQLIYIAGTDTVDQMKRLSYQAKQEEFSAFWKRHDPTPQTGENEAMEEYYTRAALADRLFSSFSTRGWRTDRGGIYILYGPPDRVEDYPPDSRFRGPYQVWRYYELDKTFTFADISGFGYYSLVLFD